MKLSCPTEHRLREYLEGAVNESDADQISDHIDSCSTCDQLVALLEDPQGQVLEQVREGLRMEHLLHEPELDQLRNTTRLPSTGTTDETKDDQRLGGRQAASRLSLWFEKLAKEAWAPFIKPFMFIWEKRSR